jgi:hypothetical protein
MCIFALPKGAAVDGRLLDAFEAHFDGDGDAAVAAVRRRAAQLLRALPTSVEEDDAVLAAAGADADDAAAAPVRLRRAQKLLLHELLEA